jgi:hypothetical protein
VSELSSPSQASPLEFSCSSAGRSIPFGLYSRELVSLFKFPTSPFNLYLDSSIVQIADMHFQATALTALIAVAQARFGQEQIPISAIAAVQGGDPGEAQTIAGAAVSDLLAATNACDKLKRADQIITELGTGADSIAAAIGMVAAEKNFNPFAQSIPTICSDPTLPATDILRGITPKIDPDVVGSDIANALSAQTVATPLDATGKSVADLLSENGFTNFTTQDSAGDTGTAPAGDSTAVTGAISTSAAVVATSAAAVGCSAAVSTTAAAAGATTTTAAATNGNTSTDTSGADFGLCTPTMKFEGGLGGRPATEFTFLPIDPLVAQGQQEALNPSMSLFTDDVSVHWLTMSRHHHQPYLRSINQRLQSQRCGKVSLSRCSSPDSSPRYA